VIALPVVEIKKNVRWNIFDRVGTSPPLKNSWICACPSIYVLILNIAHSGVNNSITITAY
jgi:hypothetical protein